MYFCFGNRSKDVKSTTGVVDIGEALEKQRRKTFSSIGSIVPMVSQLSARSPKTLRHKRPFEAPSQSDARFWAAHDATMRDDSWFKRHFLQAKAKVMVLQHSGSSTASFESVLIKLSMREKAARAEVLRVMAIGDDFSTADMAIHEIAYGCLGKNGLTSDELAIWKFAAALSDDHSASDMTEAVFSQSSTATSTRPRSENTLATSGFFSDSEWADSEWTDAMDCEGSIANMSDNTYTPSFSL